MPETLRSHIVMVIIIKSAIVIVVAVFILVLVLVLLTILILIITISIVVMVIVNNKNSLSTNNVPLHYWAPYCRFYGYGGLFLPPWWHIAIYNQVAEANSVTQVEYQNS